MPKENDILETTLAIAENGYDQAYRYLLDAYEANPERFGPQTLYFLACLAGGASLPGQALAWLHRAILDNGWWYRPEVLEDDDLAALKESAAFLSLKAISDQRYADAAARSKAVFSWKEKTSGNLFLAVHGNTQNARTAREDWSPILEKSGRWQLETIQSAEPDGYGTYRCAMTGLPICRRHRQSKACRTRAMRKSSAAGFPPDAICCCARCCLRPPAAIR